MSHSLAFIHKPMMPTMLFGVALVVVGLTVSGYVLVADDGDIQWHSTIHRLAVNATTIGVVLIIYAGLRRKGRSVEEAYRLGYDVGFENGFRAHVDDLVAGTETEAESRAARRRATRRRTAGRRREHAAVEQLRR